MKNCQIPVAIRELQIRIDDILFSLESSENYQEYICGLLDRELITETAYNRFTESNNRAYKHHCRRLDDAYLALEIASANFRKSNDLATENFTDLHSNHR